jgi:hypothetical protein
MMSNISLQFPPGFEDYEWEVDAKGWLPGVVAVIEDRRYTLTVYDAARLAQDVDDVLREGRAFFEPNLVVVPKVTREGIASAIQGIVRTGRLVELRPDQG